MKEMDAIVSIFGILLPLAIIGAGTVLGGLFVLIKYFITSC